MYINKWNKKKLEKIEGRDFVYMWWLGSRVSRDPLESRSSPHCILSFSLSFLLHNSFYPFPCARAGGALLCAYIMYLLSCRLAPRACTREFKSQRSLTRVGELYIRAGARTFMGSSEYMYISHAGIPTRKNRMEYYGGAEQRRRRSVCSYVHERERCGRGQEEVWRTAQSSAGRGLCL